jgi:D-glycero-alpha-D-manno-heptose-7-phosphate kinase
MIVCRTPLRVSLVGGGTDLPDFYQEHGGCVVGGAISASTYVIVKKRFDDKIICNYTRKETVDRPEKVKHDLIREALLMTGVTWGTEITTLADVPATGTGLGSSSSITVGLLNALYHYTNNPQPLSQLALKACEIEIERLKRPIGIQDQWFCALGGFRGLEFEDRFGYMPRQYPVLPGHYAGLEERLLLFYTGIARKSEEILDGQKKKIPEKKALLERLRDTAKDCLTRFVNANAVQYVPGYLKDGWEIKQRLAPGISSPEIDAIYRKGIAAGARGGKLVGAGGGGMMLFYVEPEKKHAVRHALRDLRELPFRFTPWGSHVLLNTGDDY